MLVTEQLYGLPFNQIQYKGVDGVFTGVDMDNIFDVVEVFNTSAVA